MKKRSNISPAAIIKNPRVICGVILFVVVTVMFAISVNMRSDYKDYVATEHHHHLTATAMAFTNNWLDDGMINDHFAMMANPKSVEFASLKDRSFYDSYPPGCIVPLYALAKVSGAKEIHFGFVQRWDLFIQYMTTLLLAFFIYLIILKLGSGMIYTIAGIAAALIPTVINLFMPAPFYFFHSVYFSDQAVLLPFMMTIFIELLREYLKDGKPRTALNIIEAVVIFAGTVTDYLFLCLLLVIYVKRLLLGEISVKSIKKWFIGSLKFAAPAIIALGLFVLQIFINGPVRIFTMLKFRTGVSDDSGWTEAFGRVFWKDYIIRGYGANADIILKASLIVVLAAVAVYIAARLIKGYKNDRLKLLISMTAIVIIPCFMQVYLLRNHSAIHDFSSLKFSLVYAVVPFVLIPAMAAEALKKVLADDYRKYVYGAAVICLAAVCCVTTYKTHKANAKDYFPPAVSEYQTVGAFLRENTDFSDVVFSYDYAIDDANNCPQKIAHSKKRVYQITDMAQIYDKVRNIEDDYTVNIFGFSGEPQGEGADELKAAAYDTVRDGNMTLYKIKREDFIALAS